MANSWQCQKCKQEPGGDWKQCKGKCPIDYSPHFKPEVASKHVPPLKVVASEGA